jgi:hypothetical protein
MPKIIDAGNELEVVIHQLKKRRGPNKYCS